MKYAVIFKSAISVGILTAVLLVVYYFSIALSDNRGFERYSLDYYLLTPALLKNLSSIDFSDQYYVYHASDGNKPMLIALSFSSQKSADETAHYLHEHLIYNGYKTAPFGFSHLDNSEITIQSSVNNGRVDVKLMMLEYLN